MTSFPDDGHFEVYWPRAARRQTRKALSPRLQSLEGKTVAFVRDYLFRGGEVFRTLQEALQDRFPGMRFVGWAEFGNTHGADEREVLAELPQRMKALGVDAAICGMAC